MIVGMINQIDIGTGMDLNICNRRKWNRVSKDMEAGRSGL